MLPKTLRSENRLLASLPRADYLALEPHLEAVALPIREVLGQAGKRMSHAYFPASGVISLVHYVAEGTGAEVAMIGREGYLGVAEMLGGSNAPTESMVQIGGQAWRINATKLRQIAFERPTVLRPLLRYAQALYIQASVAAACNARHLLPQRLARWLLVASDRSGLSELPLRHEFLSYMLGVRRAGVTDALSTLKANGLVDTARGHIALLSRPRLEAAACTCYRAVADE